MSLRFAVGLFLVLALFVNKNASASEFQERPNDPRVFPDGLLVAEAIGDQFAPKLTTFTEGQTLIAWQQDGESDPDLAFQIIDINGRGVLGADGRTIARKGVQTEPALNENLIVFRESQNGGDWTVLLGRVTPDELKVQIVSDSFETKTELKVLDLGEGRANVSWVERKNNASSIVTTFVDPSGRRETLALTTHGENVGDLQVLQNQDLLFWVWVDWRNLSSSHLFVQAWDIQSNQCLFPNNGMDATPNAVQVFDPTISSIEPGAITLTYLNTDRSGASAVQLQTIDYLGNFKFWPPKTIAGPSLSIREQASTALQRQTFTAWLTDDPRWPGQAQLHTTLYSSLGEPSSPAWSSPKTEKLEELATFAGETQAWAVVRNASGRWLTQHFDAKNQPGWPTWGWSLSNRPGFHGRLSADVSSAGALTTAWEWRASETSTLLLQQIEP